MPGENTKITTKHGEKHNYNSPSSIRPRERTAQKPEPNTPPYPPSNAPRTGTDRPNQHGATDACPGDPAHHGDGLRELRLGAVGLGQGHHGQLAS